MSLFGLAYLLLAFFDAWISAQRLPKIGIEAEYNPLVRWLSNRFNIQTGTYVGVMLPTFVIIALGSTFPRLLIFMLGCRTTLFAFQLKVMNTEKETHGNN